MKFTDSGAVLVTVTGQQLPGPGAKSVRLTVSVRDTGIGIPSDRMDRLFQPFSQVDSSTTRAYGGTGLGLVISRQLTEAMGGDLGVSQNDRVDTTFTFTAVLGVSTERRALAPGQSAGSLVGKLALIVDDNLTNRRVLQLLLQDFGMICTKVASPAAALELLATGARFDVAVLDMHMPDMDGQQLAVALRALPAGRDLPLVLLTSLQWRSDSAHRSLFVATLTKPAKCKVLQEKLLSAVAPGEAALLAVETIGGRRSRDAPANTEDSLHVLVAEDNPVNQRVAQLMLAQLGHRVDIVGNGREAVEAVRRTSYDVVLMDVRMPQLDGMRAAEMIRTELPTDCQPPIIAVTASVLTEDRAACADAWMDAYLTKPIRTEELIAVLEQVRPRAAVASPGVDARAADRAGWLVPTGGSTA